MKWIFLLFILSTILVEIESGDVVNKTCKTRLDCSFCSHCYENVCVPVGFLKDPYDDCPMICNTKMACGYDQRCIFKHPPNCLCNFTSGECLVDKTLMSNQTCVDVLESVQFFTCISMGCTVFMAGMALFRYFKSNKKKSN